MILNNSDHDWEALAKLDAYHAVLTADQYRRQNINLESFFKTGQAHIDHVLEGCRQINPAFAPDTALDFGCGVGRLLVPLSRVAGSVVGVDVSSTMLGIARQNLAERKISNVSLVQADDELSKIPTGIDFVHSYIVFQHIPVKRGEQLLHALLSKLAPGGMGALHFTFWRYATRWRKIAAKVTNINTLNGLVNMARGKRFGHPRMQINHYSLNRLFVALREHGCTSITTELVFDPPEILGAMMYFRKGIEGVVIADSQAPITEPRPVNEKQMDRHPRGTTA